MSGITADASVGVLLSSQEPIVRGAVASRSLSLETWARVVLQRYSGRFATYKVFSFLVFNMLVRFRNYWVSIISVTRKDFLEVEQVV
jgi:hypothetical protein